MLLIARAFTMLLIVEMEFFTSSNFQSLKLELIFVQNLLFDQILDAGAGAFTE